MHRPPVENSALPVKSRLGLYRNKLIFDDDVKSFGEMVAVRVSIVASADSSISQLTTQAEDAQILKNSKLHKQRDNYSD